ncbi:MAG: class I SAM-dependent methyltransferase [Polyangiaceae bacterium]|nr:class I SAM-dependent methyltransferase [Polyangiaceae bacterium]
MARAPRRTAGDLLAAAAERRRELRVRYEAVRLANGAADGVPGVTLDAFGEFLVLGVPAELALPEPWLDAAHALGARGTYLKRRPRHAARLSEADRLELAPPRAARGQDAPETLLVHEAGLVFEVRLGGGLQTGLFLDQRDNRARVRARARDGRAARVANLFGYTGAFTVAAAVGGARRTVTVDVSAPALAWAGRNLAHNGLAGEPHALLREDAMRWLARATRRAARDPEAAFDLVVLDPPSFAQTKGGRFAAEHDYRAAAAHAFGCLAPGGALLACLNHHGIDRTRLLAILRAALVDAAGAAPGSPAASGPSAELEALPPPVDFPVSDEEPGGMQSVLVTLPADRRQPW